MSAARAVAVVTSTRPGAFAVIVVRRRTEPVAITMIIRAIQSIQAFCGTYTSSALALQAQTLSVPPVPFKRVIDLKAPGAQQPPPIVFASPPESEM